MFFEKKLICCTKQTWAREAVPDFQGWPWHLGSVATKLWGLWFLYTGWPCSQICSFWSVGLLKTERTGLSPSSSTVTFAVLWEGPEGSPSWGYRVGFPRTAGKRLRPASFTRLYCALSACLFLLLPPYTPSCLPGIPHILLSPLHREISFSLYGSKQPWTGSPQTQDSQYLVSCSILNGLKPFGIWPQNRMLFEKCWNIYSIHPALELVLPF